MKNFYLRDLFILLLFVLLQVLVSCGTSEKTAITCPRIPDARNSYKARHNTGKQFKYDLYSFNQTVQRKRNIGMRSSLRRSFPASILKPINKSGVKNLKTQGKYISIVNIDRDEYLKGLSASIDNKNLVFSSIALDHLSPSKRQKTAIAKLDFVVQQEACDTIVSTMGDVIIGKVTDVSEIEIKYKRCGILNSPTYSIRRSNISVIKYANGTKDFFTSSGPVDYRYSKEDVKTEGLGLAGFIVSLAGLFVLGIPFGLIGIIFGSISLTRIKRSPGRYKGRGFALTSLIIGIIDIAGIVILLALTI
jgi:hypothetical protein